MNLLKYPFSIIIFAIIMILSSSNISYAQNISDTTLVTKKYTAISLNYLGLAMSHEIAIGNHTTLLFGTGAHYSFYGTSYPTLGTRFINVIDKNFGREYFTSGLTPYVFLETRTYMNLWKRKMRSKNILHNAGNYIAIFGELPFATGNLINVTNLAIGYPVGIKFGIRRNTNSHLSIDGSTAIVNLISTKQRTIGPRLDIALSWAL